MCVEIGFKQKFLGIQNLIVKFLCKTYFNTEISQLKQRGNALCVMGTVAHHRKLEEIYNLGTFLTQEE